MTRQNRPPRPLKYWPALLRSPFILLLIVLLVVLVVGGGVTVFIIQNGAYNKSALVSAKALIPTPNHTPKSRSIPTLVPTPSPIPTPTPSPVPTPTLPPAPVQASPPPPDQTLPPVPTPTPLPVPTPTQVSTCAGYGCDGKSPRNDYGPHGVPCWNDGAYVVAHQLVTYGVVYLWYSSGCSTNWSETVQTGGTSYIANANITRGTDNRRYDSTKFASDVWTAMVYAPTAKANACGSINNATGGCTGFI